MKTNKKIIIMVVMLITIISSMYYNSDAYKLSKYEKNGNRACLEGAIKSYSLALNYANDSFDKVSLKRELAKAYIFKANQYLEKYEWEKAEKEFENANNYFVHLSEEKKKEIDEGLNRVYYQEADELLDSKNYEESIIIFERINRKDKVAQCYYMMGDVYKAIETYEELGDLYRVGRIYEELGDIDKAFLYYIYASY